MELSSHTLMAVFAHPDDEAFGTGGTMARYAANPDCFPDQLADGCQPHRVSKVYFRALPEEQVTAMFGGDRPAAVMMDGVPFPFVGRRRDEISTVIDVSEYAEAKLRGIHCHATQVDPHSPFAETPDEVMRQPWFHSEYFILARSTVG